MQSIVNMLSVFRSSIKSSREKYSHGAAILRSKGKEQCFKLP